MHVEAAIPHEPIVPTLDYPDENFIALLQKLSSATERPIAQVLEDLGRFMAPHLLSSYATMVHPRSSTLALLSVVEDVVHRVVRLRNPTVQPPVLTCLWRTDQEMELVYSSQRRLCALAKGIIRGVAECFRETVEIAEQQCMLKGDRFCCLLVRVTSEAHEPSISADSVAGANGNGCRLLPETRWLFSHGSQSYDWLPPAKEPGDLGTLAQFRILKLLGEGGMGVVFLAEDTQLLRRVAIKVLKPSMLSQPDAERQFVREARAAGALSNDHVVPIYHIGEDHGLPFIVMPVLKGQTLRDWLASGEPVTLGRTLQIGIECAKGLAFAHDRTLIHRDIKPANIWLESPAGRVKLMDFGLTRSLVGGSQVLNPKFIVGTCQYMAPEQANCSTLIPQSDLYSLGAVLYELCTGRLPLVSDSVLGMLRALALENPLPACHLNPLVPDELNSLIMLMLSKEPEQRPGSAGDVLERLYALQSRLTAESTGWQVLVLRASSPAAAAEPPRDAPPCSIAS
jgi:predicted hydrocarbon binding protein